MAHPEGTAKTLAELMVDFATNNARNISAALLRNFVASVAPGRGRFHVTAAAPTTPPNTDDYVKALGTTLGANLHNFTHSNGRLTYIGEPDVHVTVTVNVTVLSGGSNQNAHLRVVPNGDPLDVDAIASEMDHKIGSGNDEVVAGLSYDGVMSTNDYLEPFLRNSTSLATITLKHVYFRVNAHLNGD